MPIKILVVDNDPDSLESLSTRVLELEGYIVFQANSIEAAQRILDDELIHLAIIDVRLRDNENSNDRSGLELCQELEPMVARIILTGFPEDWDLVRAAFQSTPSGRRVVDGFLSKKEDPDAFLIEIRRVLQEAFEIFPEKRLAVLTSGGDAPGMNTAIWSVVRTAMNHQIEVVGVKDGFRGLVENRMSKLRWNEVSDIMIQGGTILGASRYEEFKDDAARERAVRNLLKKRISGLVVIGGDGSMRGAQALANDFAALGRPLPVVAIPGTIDNDLWGTEMTLGAASAANAMLAELRNMVLPAQALGRIFVCEVEGRYSGYLALEAAVGIGADAVLIPEKTLAVNPAGNGGRNGGWERHVSRIESRNLMEEQLADIAIRLEQAFMAGKRYGFVLLSEGIKQLTKDELGGKFVRNYLEERIRYWQIEHPPDVREHILGYPVRGGPPSRFDIFLGARLGVAAVECILGERCSQMVGWSERDQQVVETRLDEVITHSSCSPAEALADRPRWNNLLELHEILSRPPKLFRNGSAPAHES